MKDGPFLPGERPRIPSILSNPFYSVTPKNSKFDAQPYFSDTHAMSL